MGQIGMHVIIWEFRVAPEHVDEFVRVYGPNGDWALLFRKVDGYCGTELLSCAENPERFLTIDRWNSGDDFARFQAQFREEYEALDLLSEGLTSAEVRLGCFTQSL